MDEGTVEVSGLGLRWLARGDGPPVVLVHDMASDALAWSRELEALAARGRRAIASDRRGYGASQVPAPYTATTVVEQAEDLVGVLSAVASEPVTLVGAGFGALVALDVAKRHPALVRGLVLLDPPVLQLAASATEELGRERLALQEGLREGGPAGAVEWWLGERGARDPEALARAREHAGAFFADFAGLTSWEVTRRELRELARPCVVATSPGAPLHLVEAADALTALLADVRHEADVTDLVPLALAL